MDEWILNYLPPEIAARLRLMGGGTPLGGRTPAPPIQPPMLPQSRLDMAGAQGGQGYNLPDDSVGRQLAMMQTSDQAPGDQTPIGVGPSSPGGSYLDQVALSLGQTPFSAPNPYATQGDQFLSALLTSAARGFAGGRIGQMQGREKFNDRLAALQAQRNQRNLDLSDESRKFGQQKELKQMDITASAANKSQPSADFGLTHHQDPKTGQWLPNQAPPQLPADFNLTHHVDPKSGQLVPNKAEGETLTPDEQNSQFNLDLHQEPDGRSWFDGTTYTGKTVDQARKYAASNGAKYLGKDDSSQLQDINSTIANLTDMNAKILPKLPANAVVRDLGGGAMNQGKAFLQTDEDLGAFKAYFPARIRSLRAEAGSKSFRMTNSEIDRMDKNSPRIDDTRPVWKAKMAIQLGILNRVKERIIGAAPRVLSSPTSGKVKVRAPDGTIGMMDADEQKQNPDYQVIQ